MSEISTMILKVIHKITALFLTFVLLANSLNTIIIVTDFVINQDFIAKTLCIQKEEQKGCNGKCQLRKELVENSTEKKTDRNLPSYTKLRLDVFIINTLNHKYETICSANTKSITLSKYELNPCRMLYYDIETPPPNLS